MHSVPCSDAFMCSESLHLFKYFELYVTCQLQLVNSPLVAAFTTSQPVVIFVICSPRVVFSNQNALVLAVLEVWWAILTLLNNFS